MVAVNERSVPETEEITVIKDCLQFAILVALRMEQHPSHHPPTTICSNTLSRVRLEEVPRTSLTHTLRATLCVLFGLFKLLFGSVLNRSVIEPRMCPGKPWMYLYVYSFAKSVTKKVGMYYSAGDRADNNVVKSSSSREDALHSTLPHPQPCPAWDSNQDEENYIRTCS